MSSRFRENAKGKLVSVSIDTEGPWPVNSLANLGFRFLKLFDLKVLRPSSVYLVFRNRLKCYTLSNILSSTFVQSDTILDSSAELLSKILSKLCAMIPNSLVYHGTLHRVLFMCSLFIQNMTKFDMAWNTHNLLRMRYHQKHTRTEKWSEFSIREFENGKRNHRQVLVVGTLSCSCSTTESFKY